ncbi:MAG: cytidylate kinase-like family protein [Ruminiclostridium sp.]|nr:cytidylate kinase-like family protein [Ruminiclostridium sp.]
MSEFNGIITIGREYGAGGRTVAKRISEILGIPYYDKDIIKLTSEKTGFSEEMIQDTEEQSMARTIMNWLMPSGAASSYDKAIMAQAQTIRKIAKEGPCVIVGRGADYILRDFENVINVFIYAEEEDKVKYAMDTFGESHEQAVRRVHHSDAARESYYHYLTRGKWGNLSNYHLTLNSSPIGKEACADVIIAYAQKLSK